MIALNHAVAFALELALLAVLAVYGWSLADAAVAKWALALVVAGGAALLWGWFAAPKSAARLGGLSLAAFKLAMYGSGALALAALGHPRLAAAFAALSVAQVALAVRLGVL